MKRRLSGEEGLLNAAADAANVRASAAMQRARKFALRVCHVVFLALYVPLGLVLPPAAWTATVNGGLTIAAAGWWSAVRRPLVSSLLLLVSAAWWTVAQVLLTPAP